MNKKGSKILREKWISQSAFEVALRIWTPSKTSPKVTRKKHIRDNMTKICVVNSTNYVMCSRRGNLEEHDE